MRKSSQRLVADIQHRLINAADDSMRDMVSPDEVAELRCRVSRLRALRDAGFAEVGLSSYVEGCDREMRVA